MKVFLVLSGVLIACLNVQSQSFKVVKVFGSISYSDGKAMSTGDNYKQGEKVTYKQKGSKAIIFNAEEGRKILSEGNAGSNIIPGVSNVSSRSGALLNSLDLQNFFNGDYLLLDEQKIKISSSNYPLDSGKVFFLAYIRASDTIYKKLNNKNDTLIISKQEIYKIDGEAIEQQDTLNVTLNYGTPLQWQEISTFNLITPNEKEVGSELKVITEMVKEDEKFEVARDYLNEAYGKVNDEELKVFLDKL